MTDSLFLSSSLIATGISTVRKCLLLKHQRASPSASLDKKTTY